MGSVIQCLQEEGLRDIALSGRASNKLFQQFLDDLATFEPCDVFLTGDQECRHFSKSALLDAFRSCVWVQNSSLLGITSVVKAKETKGHTERDLPARTQRIRRTRGRYSGSIASLCEAPPCIACLQAIDGEGGFAPLIMHRFGQEPKRSMLNVTQPASLALAFKEGHRTGGHRNPLAYSSIRTRL
jgi:hypothetical protein